MDPTAAKLTDEIKSFQTIWKGGFQTGYSAKRNQHGIEAYLRDNASGESMLEIGCGGGQWSKFIYSLNRFNTIHCIDVLSKEHNRFWEYVGEGASDKITYTQVSDFSLSHIPDESLDYVFSYDVFCHISKSGQREYIKSLIKKCKPGAKLFIMYADPHKYFVSEPEHRWFQTEAAGYNGGDPDVLKQILLDKSDGEPEPGRWYWVGIDAFVQLCQENGFTVLERDLNIDKTNPITLFTK